MGHMQTEDMVDRDLPGRFMPGSPKGNGGNSTLTNQCEEEIIPQSWENMPCEYTEQYSLTEDFSYVQGAYVMPSSHSEGHL